MTGKITVIERIAVRGTCVSRSHEDSVEGPPGTSQSITALSYSDASVLKSLNTKECWDGPRRSSIGSPWCRETSASQSAVRLIAVDFPDQKHVTSQQNNFYILRGFLFDFCVVFMLFFIWFSRGFYDVFYLVFTLFFIWILRGFYLCFTWVLLCFFLGFTWFLHGFYVVFTWQDLVEREGS